MTHFCLIRHGQTDWNLEGRYQGQSDAPLNDTGRAQAHDLGALLKDQSFAAIFTSDLSRAKETAEIVASYLNLPVLIDVRLREIHQGEWEGQLVGDIRKRYAELWEKRSVDPASVRPPGGETVGEVALRAHTALDDITRLHPDANVMIASHGLTLATILCKVKGIPVGKAYEVIPENAQPIWIEWRVNENSKK